VGNVEDVRKVIQDFVALDLKALSVRIEALEREMKIRFDHVDTRLDHAEKLSLERYSSGEKLATARHETLTATLAANQTALMNTLEMEKRLARLESERNKPEAQHA
jgi:hypothetical protein